MSCATPANLPLIGCCSGAPSAKYDVGLMLDTRREGFAEGLSIPKSGASNLPTTRYRLVRSRAVKATGQTYEQVWDYGSSAAPALNYQQTKSAGWDTSPAYELDFGSIVTGPTQGVYRTKQRSGLAGFGSVTITLEQPEPLAPLFDESRALLDSQLGWPDAIAEANQQPFTALFSQAVWGGPVVASATFPEATAPMIADARFSTGPGLQGLPASSWFAGDLGTLSNTSAAALLIVSPIGFLLRLGKVKFKQAPECVWTFWERSPAGSVQRSELGCSTSILPGGILNPPSTADIFVAAANQSALVRNWPFPRYPWPGIVAPSCCPQFAFP